MASEGSSPMQLLFGLLVSSMELRLSSAELLGSLLKLAFAVLAFDPVDTFANVGAGEAILANSSSPLSSPPPPNFVPKS